MSPISLPQASTASPSRRSAIHEKCIDCSGGSAHEARNCQLKKCALWPFRPGNTPTRVLSQKAIEANKRNGERLRQIRR